MKGKIIILILIFCLISNRFALAIEKNRDYYEQRGEVVWEVPTDQKVIALTFDDGPDGDFTPLILDVLKKYDAKGTFFVTGKQVLYHPKLLKREMNEGHEIGNHSFSHLNAQRLTKEAIKKDILKEEQIINSLTGGASKFFRPPGGNYNENIVNAARELGYLVVMWSWHQDTKDWSNPGVKKIANKVLSNARKGDIILFHDCGGNRLQTVKALEEILPKLQQRGYRFVTVSELIGLKRKK